MSAFGTKPLSNFYYPLSSQSVATRSNKQLQMGGALNAIHQKAV
jgi:hypothetical protein